jgi:hypothetical protein
MRATRSEKLMDAVGGILLQMEDDAWMMDDG